MQPWVYFLIFDPLSGRKNMKMKGSFRFTSNPEHPENDFADCFPKSKTTRRRQRLNEWSKRFSHPQKSGWYIFTAILCALVALLSLCLGWIGIIPVVIFSLGVWVNIANYRKFKK